MYNKRPSRGWCYVLSVLLPALSIWLYADLAGSVDLLQQARLWLAADPWQVFWIYGAASLIWMLLGRNLISTYCRFAYPFAGAWAVNAAFLLAIDGGASTSCGKLLGLCWGWFRDTLAGSVVFWICFAIALIVLILLNLERVLDFVFGNCSPCGAYGRSCGSWAAWACTGSPLPRCCGWILCGCGLRV